MRFGERAIGDEDGVFDAEICQASTRSVNDSLDSPRLNLVLAVFSISAKERPMRWQWSARTSSFRQP
jgi:hypothetical protein